MGGGEVKQLDWAKKKRELINNMVTVARLVFVTFQLTEWYNEVWERAVYDKLIRDIKFKKECLIEN